jgi:aminopeptidase N
MVNTFEKRFGKYPFEKVGYVITPIGSMEHETMISYDSALVKNYYSAQDTVNIVAAHELSHQWFGDMVTCRDFRDTWLNEGFATFCESLWHEELFGFNNALDYLTSKASDYINYIANSNSQYFEGLFPIYDYPRTPPSSNYPGTIYYKGSVVLGMLRYELGDSLFFKGLLEYLNRYKFGVATTDSLRSVLEGVCGKPLDWFFNQWIYQKGWPKLSVEVDRLPSDYKGFVKLNVKINQNQIDAYGLYSNLPVEIGFKKFNGDYEYRIFKVSAKNENFDMDSIPDFTSITVNQGPHVRILADISSVITTVDETAVLNKKMIDIFPDPADSNINIYFHADMGPIKLLLTDMNGNEVFHDSINNICEEVYKINTQNFSSGTYFIVMEMPGFNERHSIRIVH